MLNNKQLTTMGQAVTCLNCGQVSYAYLKGTGYQPYLWEVNCEQCHLFCMGLNSYKPGHRRAVDELQELMNAFLNQEPMDDLMPRIEELADTIDSVLDFTICECGGRLSLKAKARCLHCDAILVNSVFHYVDESVSGTAE